MPARWFRFAQGLILLGLSTRAFAADDLLTPGRELAAQLKLDQTADEKLFTAIGVERTQAVLMAVMAKGQERGATPADRANLHRAVTGLVEMQVFSHNLLKAAVFCNFQEAFYRNLEHDYTAALDFARRAYDLEQQSGETATQYLNLKNIGEDLLRLGRPKEAIAALHQAQQAVTDPYVSGAAYIWQDLLQADIDDHDNAQAEADLTRFVEAARSAPPAFRVESLISTATLRIEQAQYSQAIDVLGDALRAIKGDAKAGTVTYEIAGQLLSIVLASMHSVSYDDALVLTRRIDKEFAQLSFPVTPIAEEVIRMRRRLAGDIDGVLREDTARLAAARAAGNIAGQSEALQSLAVSYQALHSSRQQAAALEEALDLEKQLLAKASTPPEKQTAIYNLFLTMYSLGEAYLAERDLRNAKLWLDEVLKGIPAIADGPTREDAGRMFGPATLGKARALELDDEVDDARDLLTASLAKKGFDRGDTLIQLARLERNQNERPADAVKRYDEAIDEMHAQKRTDMEIVARLEFAQYLAGGKSKVADFAARAGEQLDALRTLAKTANMADALWRMNYIQGVAAESAGETGPAIASYQAAVDQLDRIRAGLSQQEQRQSFMDNETVDDLYRRLTGLLVSSGRTGDAWQSIERGKARSFLEMMQGRRFRDAAPETAELRAMEQRLIDLRVELAPQHEQILRSAGKDPVVLTKEMTDLQGRFTLARQEAALSGSRQGQLLSLRPAKLEETRRLIPAQTALVEYAFLPDSMAAFVVTHSGERVLSWKTDLRQLKAKVSRARALLADGNSGAELDPLLDDLSAALIKPLLSALPADVRNLVIVPASYLNYLPFQVLPLDAKRRMIDRFTISYLPSSSTLHFLKGPAKPGGNLFVGALGNVSVDGWAPLPGTLRESAAIQNASPGAHHLSEAAFTHDALRLALTQYDTVHVATHGLLDEHAPLFSALLVSPAEGQPSRLSLYEITDIKMRARVVVLSACETGLGKLLAGDEVAGLTRTFLQAGADTVVSSLWKVSDDSTALLMAGFHARMRRGEGAAQALREAAMDVRQKYPHPFYWAPFVLTGAR